MWLSISLIYCPKLYKYRFSLSIKLRIMGANIFWIMITYICVIYTCVPVTMVLIYCTFFTLYIIFQRHDNHLSPCWVKLSTELYFVTEIHNRAGITSRDWHNMLLHCFTRDNVKILALSFTCFYYCCNMRICKYIFNFEYISADWSFILLQVWIMLIYELKT